MAWWSPLSWSPLSWLLRPAVWRVLSAPGGLILAAPFLVVSPALENLTSFFFLILWAPDTHWVHILTSRQNIQAALLVHLWIRCQLWDSALLSKSYFVPCSRQIPAHPGLEQWLPGWKKSHLLS